MIPFYEEPTVVKFMEAESGMVVAREKWGVSYYLMEIEFQFGKTKTF